ncbi:MAG: glycosyltransferase [Armatimonadota bacterium]|nr:glycosyltransferase [Armatimonadota bacterium]MDR7559065.1 glycosyltransferase [Armatimonadota bacterium]
MRSLPPLLSVVVTTYSKDRLPDLFALLESLKVQTYPHLEILFVGEGSEQLCEKVQDYTEHHTMPNVTALFNSGEPGLSSARNIGIRRAAGEIIAFLDDDTLAFPDWAHHTVAALAREAVAGITGPALPLWEDPQMDWFPEELYWILSCTGWSGWDQVRDVRNAWGMNCAFRRQVFETVGLFRTQTGYHKGLFAEDNEFSLRVRLRTGKRILYVPHARVWHRVRRYRLSWSFMRKRAYWIGRSRRHLLQVFAPHQEGPAFLHQEHELLQRIVRRRIPTDLANVLSDPSRAMRRLAVTAWALLFVGLGYYTPTRADGAQLQPT